VPFSASREDHKQRVDNSSGPHAEQDRETQTANGKEIDHQIDPKGPRKPHLGEDTKGWDEQSDDVSTNIASGHGVIKAMPLS